MRNLKLLYSVEEKFADIIQPKLLNLGSRAGEFYVITNDKLLACDHRNKVVKVLGEVVGVVSCEYLSLNNEISLVCSTGEVLLYKTHSSKIEEVSYCDGGIEMMSWSPDQEIIVFITKQHSVVLMNSGYDVISEFNLLEDVFGENEFITVGWGEYIEFLIAFCL